MTRHGGPIRVLWLTERNLDADLYSAPCVEMVLCLQQSCAMQLLASCRQKEVQPEGFQNKVAYYRSCRRPLVRRLSRYVAQWRALDSMVESFRPDVVFFNCDNPLLLGHAARVARRSHARLVYDVRTLPVDTASAANWITDRLLGSCLRYASRHFDGITYITDAMRQYCAKRYGLAPHASEVWTSGVNPDAFTPSAEDRPAGPFTILYHGSINKPRKIHHVIRAVSLLDDIDVQLVLLGKGDAVGELKELAAQLGSQGRVSFQDPVRHEEVPRWIVRCDVGIDPLQDWVGWNVSSPIKVFEYLACAKPVIVTDIPAHRSVLQGCDFAFWAGQGSPEDLASAIRQAYARREDLPRLGQQGRDLVLREHTWAHQSERLLRFFEGFTQ